MVRKDRECMYGLPKIHKPDIPLRSILSMCHSVQHSLAKWLIQLLNPVLAFYSGFCVNDSFTFSSMICQLLPCVDSQFMVSFHITSQFTNVPQDEVISICTDSVNICPFFSWKCFRGIDGIAYVTLCRWFAKQTILLFVAKPDKGFGLEISTRPEVRRERQSGVGKRNPEKSVSEGRRRVAVGSRH